MEATTFLLVRHGQTRWNEEGRIQGWLDSPLTNKGRAWALDWGERLAARKPGRIVCSPLGRAVQTAEAFNRFMNLPLDTDPRLREQDWGRWTGLTLSEVKRHHSGELAEGLAKGWEFTPPGGESRKQVLARALEALDAQARLHPGQTLLTVTHEGVVKCLVYHLLGRDFLPHEPIVLEKRSLNTVIHNGALRLGALNEEP